MQLRTDERTADSHTRGFAGPPGAGLARAVLSRWRMSADMLHSAPVKGECPLCYTLVQATDDLMADVLGAPGHPDVAGEQVAEARGFCGIHGWRLLEAGLGCGRPPVAVIRSIREMVIDAVSALDQYGAAGAEARLDPKVFKRTVRYGWTKRVARRLEPTKACPVCIAIQLIDEGLGYQLIELLALRDVRAGYQTEWALCLPHFRWALHTAQDRATLDCLVKAERERLRSLLVDQSLDRWSTLAHVMGARWAVLGR
jgi:hypothetical protein